MIFDREWINALSDFFCSIGSNDYVEANLGGRTLILPKANYDVLSRDIDRFVFYVSPLLDSRLANDVLAIFYMTYRSKNSDIIRVIERLYLDCPRHRHHILYMLVEIFSDIGNTDIGAYFIRRVVNKEDNIVIKSVAIMSIAKIFKRLGNMNTIRLILGLYENTPLIKLLCIVALSLICRTKDEFLTFVGKMWNMEGASEELLLSKCPKLLDIVAKSGLLLSWIEYATTCCRSLLGLFKEFLDRGVDGVSGLFSLISLTKLKFKMNQMMSLGEADAVQMIENPGGRIFLKIAFLGDYLVKQKIIADLEERGGPKNANMARKTLCSMDFLLWKCHLKDEYIGVMKADYGIWNIDLRIRPSILVTFLCGSGILWVAFDMNSYKSLSRAIEYIDFVTHYYLPIPTVLIGYLESYPTQLSYLLGYIAKFLVLCLARIYDHHTDFIVVSPHNIQQIISATNRIADAILNDNLRRIKRGHSPHING